MSWVLLIYTLAIWLVGLGGVLAPIVVASYNKMVLAVCNSFAAGVMLSAGFVHLLHDAVSSLSGLQEKLYGFPISEFVCAFSFIMVFYIETLFAPPVKSGEHHHLDHIQVDKGTECFPSQWEWQAGDSPSGLFRSISQTKIRKSERQDLLPPLPQYGAVMPRPAPSSSETEPACEKDTAGVIVENHMNENESKSATKDAGRQLPRKKDSCSQAGKAAHQENDGMRTGLLAHLRQTQAPILPSQSSEGHNESEARSLESTHGRASPGSKSPSTRRPHPGMSAPSHNHSHSHKHSHSLSHSHSHDEAHGHKDVHTVAGALCLLAALGFHSVMEGLGLATATSQSLVDGGGTQVGVFLAILAHKGLAGLTLGSTMLLAEVSQTEFLLTAVLFSAATPAGVALGVLISSYYHTAATVGLMGAVAAGTFIHVAAIEIIPSAFRDSSATQLTKLMSLTVGFLAMSALFLVA